MPKQLTLPTILPERLERFLLFHRENPDVYSMFRFFALEAKRSGVSHYGGRAIAERIRWHKTVENRVGEFKYNDHLTGYYTRLLMLVEPMLFGGFFERRDARFDADDETLLFHFSQLQGDTDHDTRKRNQRN
jgi:hypothetical protein